MEKIVERYTLENVFKVIDKHIEYHESMIRDYQHDLLIHQDNRRELLQEIRDSCSAIASLRMLKHELNGDVEY